MSMRVSTPHANDTEKRILIIEDDSVVAEVTAKLLAAKGYVPVVATNALDGLRQPASRSFALALIDISLGGELDGVDVAEWITRLYRIPVVFATSTADDDMLARARRVKPAAYLVKPVEPAQLYTTVALALDAPRAEPDTGHDRDHGPQSEFLRRKFGQIATVVDEVRIAERVKRKVSAAVLAGIEELSQREWQIMRDLIRDPDVDAIAQRRHLSSHTVQNHVKSIFKKLKVHSTAELLSLLLSE
jgi:DNA-binding NarL/FixJ family response regulator